MPLIKSNSSKAASKNISTLIREGKKTKQAIAIAKNITKKKKDKHNSMTHYAKMRDKQKEVCK